jgi:hypothetical protein
VVIPFVLALVEAWFLLALPTIVVADGVNETLFVTDMGCKFRFDGH